MGDPPARLVHPPSCRDATPGGVRAAGRLRRGQRLGGLHRRRHRVRSVGRRLGAGQDDVSNRRRAIVEAALAVIGRGGVDAVTHRAVAGEAGVPLAATTYYFGSKAELVQEALELVITRSGEIVDEYTRIDGELNCDGLVDRLTGFAQVQLEDR